MAHHTHYHSDNVAADSGTIALVVLLLGVLIIGLIAYRTLWAGRTVPQNTIDTTVTVPSVNTTPGTTVPGTVTP